MEGRRKEDEEEGRGGEGPCMMFSVRIVSMDYYMSPPIPGMDPCYSPFQGQLVSEVPVVRIYGPTPIGQQTCLHLHKAFPYLYIPYDDDLPQNLAEVSAKRQHVHSCSLVRAKKFYGFHPTEQLFVKIVLYYPQEVSRLSSLLTGGGILNKKFQPYESHIPYLLQVLVDHNLAGMGLLRLSNVKFRGKLPDFFNKTRVPLKQIVQTLVSELVERTDNGGETEDAESQSEAFLARLMDILSKGEKVDFVSPTSTDHQCEIWLSKNVPPSWTWAAVSPSTSEERNSQEVSLTEKQSFCQLEADASVEGIIMQLLNLVNLFELLACHTRIPFLIHFLTEILNRQDLVYIPLSKAAPEVRMVQSLVPVWEECERSVEGVSVMFDGNLSVDRSIQIPSYDHEFRNVVSEMIQNQQYTALTQYPETVDLYEGEKNNADALLEEFNSSALGSPSISEEHALKACSQRSIDVQLQCCVERESSKDSMAYIGAADTINENIVSQISEDAIAKEAEEETIDLLRWMVSSQKDPDEEQGECEEDELYWKQVFQSVDEALGKAVSNYENLSQQECDAILDCIDVHGRETETELIKDEDKELHSLDASKYHSRSQDEKLSPGLEEAAQPISNIFIPQFDGSCDEEPSSENISSEAGKKLEPVEQVVKDLSVRDMMREKRKRKLLEERLAVEVDGSKMISGNFQITPTESREQSLKYGLLPLVKCNVHDLASPTSSQPKENSDNSLENAECSNVVLPAHDESILLIDNVDHIAVNEISKDDASQLFRLQSDAMGVTKEDGEKWFTFSRKPPSVDRISNIPVDNGHTFYGNPQDIPNQPVMMAGLLFEVKSKEVVHLPEFSFGTEIDRKQDSIRRDYCQEEAWGPGQTKDLVMGVQSHIQNNGVVTFLLTPAKPPPSASNVSAWLEKNKAEWKNHSAGVLKVEDDPGLFSTPDSPLASQDNWSQSAALQKESGTFRPASPKYDEFHVFSSLSDNTPEESSQPVSLKKHDQDTSLVCKETKETKNTIDMGIFQGPNKDVEVRIKKGGRDTSLVCKEIKETKNTMDQGIFEGPNKVIVTKVQQRYAEKMQEVSQITAPTLGAQFTPPSQAGFRDPANTDIGQQILIMSIEVHAETRGDLRPDPRYDSIACIVIVLQQDDFHNAAQSVVLLRDDRSEAVSRDIDGIFNCHIVTLKNEAMLLYMFIGIVQLCDPDMLVGWEIQGFSLGLLAERSSILGINLLKQLSRIPPIKKNKAKGTDGKGPNQSDSGTSLFDKMQLEIPVMNEPIIDDEWGRTHGSGLHVGGRVVLNLWRIMQSEVKVGMYSLEAIAEAVLKKKVPRISWRTLTNWFRSGSGQRRFLCIEYFIERAKLNLLIINQRDLINRTSELARVFGIDFFSVLSRGSQYRVESMLLRIAHTQNFLLLSPTRQQVASQPAMECLPLVMEPESRFYTDPVVVLDFQSLYPSMIIAYNLCYSTCLGKIVSDNPKVLGASSLKLKPGLLAELKDVLTFTPNGVMYTPSKEYFHDCYREILSTRIMVKQAMKKLSPNQKFLQRALDARQFALKLIANVTYGYTAAGFSGRMPCAEIADSIVSIGRNTLERSIDLVNLNPKWRARVVYGDTDSMFVLLEGRTREEAFVIGQEIASAVTKMNPRPVTLKMEKVYQPCFLITKKRYVGYSYDSPTQLKPTFDAKGIETIRRDSCGAVAKMLEKSLRILFETYDLSQSKAYLQRQWGKILNGRVSLKDFIFAKEVRLGTYSARASVLPPAAIVATKAMAFDPRAEPRYGERVPYIVIHGEPGARLVDMVVDPYVLLDVNSSLRLHETYYITKQIIPAIQRILGLVGVDLKAWYAQMPRSFRPSMAKRISTNTTSPVRAGRVAMDLEQKSGQRGSSYRYTIDRFYISQHCAICGELNHSASSPICDRCKEDEMAVAITLIGKTSQLERQFRHLEEICQHCGGADKDIEDGIKCISLDCSVFFERVKVEKEFKAASFISTQCTHSAPPT